MWARDMELCLGLWLLISPFVFDHPTEDASLWATDLACASLVVVLSLASYVRKFPRAHLAELGVAAWLIATGWVAARQGEATAAEQNHILVGLLVAMFAIVPGHASQPPTGWSREGVGGDSL